jgi:hypothetical protein
MFSRRTISTLNAKEYSAVNKFSPVYGTQSFPTTSTNPETESYPELPEFSRF